MLSKQLKAHHRASGLSMSLKDFARQEFEQGSREWFAEKARQGKRKARLPEAKPVESPKTAPPKKTGK